ncbi:MAG: helicase-related protein, partial [Desulfatibacillaceae bacterium]|nr:helicase-related protein [Desulfatibacillaceae bacterium]
EYELYKAVTAYINEFMAHGTGRRKQSVALARTVIQRRLASSTNAIFESLQRRFEKQRKLLEELEVLPPKQRAIRLAQIQGRLSDAELDEDDLDDISRDELIDEFTVAMELDQIREEIEALRELKERGRRVKDLGRDSKLEALRQCLNQAQFSELKDGKGKLIIFTEHRDTLTHLLLHLHEWGYTTCEIHGGMNPHQRKQAQEQFRTQAQICVATEAAGEGINLQFCHLMINYDLPWNPTRLEQRLGRIHRIGQKHDVYVFNFVADESEDGQPIIEGRILSTLLLKLDQMRAILNDRVFDVVGEILSLNQINLPEMLREAAYDPRRLEDYIEQLQDMDPERLKSYEQATGIALAKSSVDFSDFQKTNVEVEERRLMPKYVEEHFVKAAAAVELKTEPRADGLWRIPHVLADLRSDRLEAVRQYGKSESSYKKVTFHKEHLDQTRHLDAVLMGPGHSLYAAVDEKLNAALEGTLGGAGAFVDDLAEAPYQLHFFEVSIRGQDSRGRNIPLFAELIAVRQEQGLGNPGEQFSILPADCLLDLPSHPLPPNAIPVLDGKPASDFVKISHQMEMRQQCQKDREHFAQVCREYLEKSFSARIRAAQDRVMQLCARERDSPEMALARQRAENDLEDLKSLQKERMAGLSRLSVARHGPVRHIATALVFPAEQMDSAQLAALAQEADPALRRRIELAAEDAVIQFENSRGRECERVGHMKIGFDIRSLASPDPDTGYRDPVLGVRRIEVKGRKRGQPIRLTPNEWYKAVQLAETYWLYVIWDPLDNPGAEPIRIQNPAKHLDYAKREVVTARVFEIPAEAICKFA